DLREERAIQVRLPTSALERERVELEDRVPLGIARLVAAQMVESYFRLGDAPALALRFLALRGAEPGEKVVEVGVAVVVPVELACFAAQQAGGGEALA